MSGPVIDIKNLLVVYNLGKSNENVSLEDVSIKIFPGEYVIIFGPSGCGKSTLLYTIAGLQRPTSGEVKISGKDISTFNRNEVLKLHQKGIGMIFQAFYLITSLNIIDNVCLPKVFIGESPAKRKDDGMKLLRRFSISEQAHKFPNQISGGQKQRVAIARSLINDPDIILADEPVGNLDSESAHNVLNIIKELNEADKKTVVMVTHNSEHLSYADRVIYMKDGKITNETVNQEKRPAKFVKEEGSVVPVSISGELKLLLRTFKNFTQQEVGGLIVPYKAKQLMAYILSDFSEEQVRASESFLKDLLFGITNFDTFVKNLDKPISQGGAGWNKKTAETFSKRIEGIIEQADIFKKDLQEASTDMAYYLIRVFNLSLNEEARSRMISFIRLRAENKLDGESLRQRLDAPFKDGGVGLYKGKADKVAKEIEMIMLIKYSGKK